MAEPVRVKITCDTTEACALLAELRARVEIIGRAEAERRLGCNLDDAFDNAFLIESAGSTVRWRLAPTPAFEASLRKLW